MHTSSISFPNMFDVARNSVSVLEDGPSVVSRVRLLMLTEPTELYNELDFGVGMKRHLWQYNTENQKAILKDRIIDQLRKHEPCCIPEETAFADGLLFTGDAATEEQSYNQLKLTVGVACKFGGNVEVTINGSGQ